MLTLPETPLMAIRMLAFCSNADHLVRSEAPALSPPMTERRDY
jgi:hypothetical protein